MKDTPQNKGTFAMLKSASPFLLTATAVFSLATFTIADASARPHFGGAGHHSSGHVRQSHGGSVRQSHGRPSRGQISRISRSGRLARATRIGHHVNPNRGIDRRVPNRISRILAGRFNGNQSPNARTIMCIRAPCNLPGNSTNTNTRPPTHRPPGPFFPHVPTNANNRPDRGGVSGRRFGGGSFGGGRFGGGNFAGGTNVGGGNGGGAPVIPAAGRPTRAPAVQPAAAPAPAANCLRRTTQQDGTVLFEDLCTGDYAVTGQPDQSGDQQQQQQ